MTPNIKISCIIEKIHIQVNIKKKGKEKNKCLEEILVCAMEQTV